MPQRACFGVKMVILHIIHAIRGYSPHSATSDNPEHLSCLVFPGALHKMGLWEDYYDQGRAYVSFYFTVWYCLFILVCEWISALFPKRKTFRGETILITGECILEKWSPFWLLMAP